MGWLEKFFKGSWYLFPGIDIGTSSIKIVQSEKRGNSYRVKGYGRKEYREQVFAGTEIIDELELINTLKSLLKEMKLN